MIGYPVGRDKAPFIFHVDFASAISSKKGLQFKLKKINVLKLVLGFSEKGYLPITRPIDLSIRAHHQKTAHQALQSTGVGYIPITC